MTTRLPDPTIEFWFDFASPYSYLAAMRIEGALRERSTTLRWKPFLLGPIFKRRRSNPSPFQQASPDEQRYRRRDVERMCKIYDLPLQWPSTYPRGSLLATRVALIAAEEGWCNVLTRSVFQANFTQDRDIADVSVVRDILDQLGKDASRLIAAASSEEVKRRLVAQVDHAIARGIFGAPSFLCGDELFWGNDRLDQAIAWQADKRDRSTT